MSLSRIVAKTVNPQEKEANAEKTIVVVGTVTDDTRCVQKLDPKPNLNDLC
jgi:ribosomal protein L18E